MNDQVGLSPATFEGVDRSYALEASPLPEVLTAKDVFAFEMLDDCLIEDGIKSGDYVLVERTSTAQNGDIILALIKGAKSVIVGYSRDCDLLCAQHQNPEIKPVLVPGNQVVIHGRILGKLRSYHERRMEDDR